MTVAKPASRPNVPHFSSGPCAKRPGWNPQNLKDAALGRSHRAKVGKAKLKLAIELTREVLEVPADYKIGIVPASDTGAVEMALWSLLGARGVDVLAFESFSEAWATDVVKQLKLPDARVLNAPYGQLPDLAAIDPARLTDIERLERPALDANIRARLFELEAVRTWERSPQHYSDILATSLAGQALFAYAPLAERARRLTAIAHPDFREELDRAAHAIAQRGF